MKQRLKYLLILIYPFWVYIGYIYWGNYNQELIFKLFSYSAPVIYITAFLSSISLLISSFKNKLKTRDLAIRNFFSKLLHIPPFIMIFMYSVAGAYQPHDMEEAFNFAVVFLGILILITGLLGTSTIIAAFKERKYSKFMIPIFVVLGLAQFIFIIDVFAALILLIITLFAARKDKQILLKKQGEHK